MNDTLYQSGEITQMAKDYFAQKRAQTRLDGWFLTREVMAAKEAEVAHLPLEVRTAMLQAEAAQKLDIDISEHAIFAGTQDDAFARSYALINPNFKVASFSGYCDPTAVFGDIQPDETITAERIEALRAHTAQSPYVKQLAQVYEDAQQYTGEVTFFIEQVTGHLIPDFRGALRYGVLAMIAELDQKLVDEVDEQKKETFEAMRISLNAVLTLAQRYADLAHAQQAGASPRRRAQLEKLEGALRHVPANGARTLYEAIQSFILLWQMMCLEQAPNPFAFSVGNADRIFEPYRQAEGLTREQAAEYFKHFLVFFNVADRSWAISQNVLVSGRDVAGNDLTNTTSYAILDAYFDMNLPQPILSVKLHKQTPREFYRELGRFLFTPGCLTPSFFNDDALFQVLGKAGVAQDDLPDYAVAGCQEPLIMGKDNANTTNSWLNLGKILELTLNDGISSLTGERILPARGGDAQQILSDIRQRFYDNVALCTQEMVKSANGASKALSNLRVPFLSAFMGGMQSGIDMRDDQRQGTRYNGSGCLIHGLSVVSDSFIAIDQLLRERPQDAQTLLDALRANFDNQSELQQYLRDCPKYGNNIALADGEAAQVAARVSDCVAAQKNYLGNAFRPDWSTPSTHLLYGYWVGATPDGRHAREMLGYGIDPLYGDANQGLGFRVLSHMQLPFEQFSGGYASHFGIDPKYFDGVDLYQRGEQFYDRILAPLFFNPLNDRLAPSYLYVNVTTPQTLRKVLDNPKKYAPNGVYIMRIHGTFVNFLDLSPEIQQDIIKRLDLESTAA